jgi:hypothetical protein
VSTGSGNLGSRTSQATALQPNCLQSQRSTSLISHIALNLHFSVGSVTAQHEIQLEVFMIQVT